MLIIIDKKIPEPAKETLRNFGHLLELETRDITYPAISGHPDIFFTQIDSHLVVAPNLPEPFKEFLLKRKIKVETGLQPVGTSYPSTAHYNAVATSDSLIHNHKTTDSVILKLAAEKRKIKVNQGYTRCNLFFITPGHAITSDEGILKTLSKHGIEVLFFKPKGIILPGFASGFVGGACGMLDNRLFITGNPDWHSDGLKLRVFCKKAGVELWELYDGPLFDGGGILFVEEKGG